MAGDWIKWCKGLASRREVAVLASRLGRDRHEIAGRLMVLWEWCDDNATDSDVDSASPNVSLILGDTAAAFVDALLGLPGFADALASPEVHWIEFRSGGRVVFPNLARHNGTSAKTRAYEAQKKRNQRSKSPADSGEMSPRMSPEIRDKSGTRGEKRRVIHPQEITPSDVELPATPEAPPKRFVRPSLADVAAYCQERGNSVDASRFVNYYTANGWKVGKNAMKDWKATVRTWEGNENGRPGATDSRRGYGGVSGSAGPRVRDSGLLDQLAREVASAEECSGVVS